MPAPAFGNIVDRATAIAAGILANPAITASITDLDNPDRIAERAVRIARAVEDAWAANRSQFPADM